MSRVAADRRGFALPAVILLVALLTVLLTSGLSRARTERQIAQASDEMATALTVAQSGLQTYMGTVTSRPADGDSTRINVIGGFANVVVHLVRRPADSTQRSLYLVRSTGIAINPDSGSAPRARRTVAQFAEWEPAYLLRRAAFTAANGIRKNAGSELAWHRISGVDWGSVCSPSEASIPGLRTTDTALVDPDPAVTYQGSPGLIEHGAGQGAAIAAQTGVDWAAALGPALVPDYTTFRNGDWDFPIQRVLGNLTPPVLAGGSGLLIVSGDMTIEGALVFNGVILVGGDIDFDENSSVVVRGLVVSGLNYQLGMSPGRSDIGDGLILDIRFASCYVEQAAARLRGFAPVRNAWLDTWATY
jgi:hypothetical protein